MIDNQNQPNNSTTEISTARAAQEVQAAVILAKRFPRDETAAANAIFAACKRPGFAKSSAYEYERGNTVIREPSIKMAEQLAKSWGNIDFGIVELSQTPGENGQPGESEMMAYCWDLETNVRQTKIFQVPHVRKARGELVPITDPRDIYEHCANNGARRLRKCIFGIIPADILETAFEICTKTARGLNDKRPHAERVAEMLEKFSAIGVNRSRIEYWGQCSAENLDGPQIDQLAQIYRAIQTGELTQEFFEGPQT